jgi:hypothetical protein
MKSRVLVRRAWLPALFSFRGDAVEVSATSRRPSLDDGEEDPEASDACVHSMPRSMSTHALLRREGTAARDRCPHRSMGAPVGPEGRGNDPVAFKYIPKIVLM